MCGIWSAIGDYDPKIVEIMGYRMATRGTHATGFFNGYKVVKDAKPSYDFLASPEISQKLRNHKGYILGHTRMASSGNAHLKDNAHPFKIGGIVGIHNGGINNEHTLGKMYGVTYDVDSMYLIHAISRGHLSKVSGWLACMWYDYRDHTISWVRHQAPLFMGATQGCIYFASTAACMQDMVDQVASTEEDVVYTFNISTGELKEEPIVFTGKPAYYTGKSTYCPKVGKWNDYYDDDCWPRSAIPLLPTASKDDTDEKP